MLGKYSTVVVDRHGRGLTEVTRAVKIMPYEKFFTNKNSQEIYEDILNRYGESFFDNRVLWYDQDLVRIDHHKTPIARDNLHIRADGYNTKCEKIKNTRKYKPRTKIS